MPPLTLLGEGCKGTTERFLLFFWCVGFVPSVLQTTTSDGGDKPKSISSPEIIDLSGEDDDDTGGKKAKDQKIAPPPIVVVINGSPGTGKSYLLKNVLMPRYIGFKELVSFQSLDNFTQETSTRSLAFSIQDYKSRRDRLVEEIKAQWKFSSYKSLSAAQIAEIEKKIDPLWDEFVSTLRHRISKFLNDPKRSRSLVIFEGVAVFLRRPIISTTTTKKSAKNLLIDIKTDADLFDEKNPLVPGIEIHKFNLDASVDTILTRTNQRERNRAEKSRQDPKTAVRITRVEVERSVAIRDYNTKQHGYQLVNSDQIVKEIDSILEKVRRIGNDKLGTSKVTTAKAAAASLSSLSSPSSSFLSSPSSSLLASLEKDVVEFKTNQKLILSRSKALKEAYLKKIYSPTYSTLSNKQVYLALDDYGGIGLFANHDFKKGEVITTYGGSKRTRDQINGSYNTSHIAIVYGTGQQVLRDGSTWANILKESSLDKWTVDQIAAERSKTPSERTRIYPIDIDISSLPAHLPIGSVKEMIENSGVGYMVNTNLTGAQNVNYVHVPFTKEANGDGETRFVMASKPISKGDEIFGAYNNSESRVVGVGGFSPLQPPSFTKVNDDKEEDDDDDMDMTMTDVGDYRPHKSQQVKLKKKTSLQQSTPLTLTTPPPLLLLPRPSPSPPPLQVKQIIKKTQVVNPIISFAEAAKQAINVSLEMAFKWQEWIDKSSHHGKNQQQKQHLWVNCYYDCMQIAYRQRQAKSSIENVALHRQFDQAFSKLLIFMSHSSDDSKEFMSILLPRDGVTEIWGMAQYTNCLAVSRYLLTFVVTIGTNSLLTIPQQNDQVNSSHVAKWLTRTTETDEWENWWSFESSQIKSWSNSQEILDFLVKMAQGQQQQQHPVEKKSITTTSTLFSDMIRPCILGMYDPQIYQYALFDASILDKISLYINANKNLVADEKWTRQYLPHLWNQFVLPQLQFHRNKKPSFGTRVRYFIFATPFSDMIAVIDLANLTSSANLTWFKGSARKNSKNVARGELFPSSSIDTRLLQLCVYCLGAQFEISSKDPMQRQWLWLPEYNYRNDPYDFKSYDYSSLSRSNKGLLPITTIILANGLDELQTLDLVSYALTLSKTKTATATRDYTWTLYKLWKYLILGGFAT